MLLRTSASLSLRVVSQRTLWQLIQNELRRRQQQQQQQQRSFTNSQSLLDTPGSSSSKSTITTSHGVSSAYYEVEKNSDSHPSTPTPQQQTQHSPMTVAFVKGFAWLMGYKTKTSIAIRETRDAYSLCAERDVEEANFIQNQCRLAPTYQTWFQIANLHVWLVRTRYRALPGSHGKIYDQELINHFFLDVEDRMRAALGYKAPERIIKGYMMEMQDQWTGATFSFDLGLVGSDAELSGAIWRNVFASRGLDGKGEVIGKPGSSSEPRAIDNNNNSDNNAARVEDSSSSSSSLNTTLSDSALAELPFHLYVFTSYVRRELERLESLSDEQVLGGDIGSFGSMESHALAGEKYFVLEKEERKLLGLVEDVPSTRTSTSPFPKMKRRTANA